jgi:hypothetical protein
MRKWGILITVSYALIVLGLLVPGAVFLYGDKSSSWRDFFGGVRGVYLEWLSWIPIGIVLAGQALLLFLSVDTSRKRLKPRAHILVSSSLTAMLLALLTFAALFSLAAGVYGDKLDNSPFFNSEAKVLAMWGFLWLFWGILFHLYFRNSTELLTRAISWLLKGSVLELLVAVPCHVIVRRRHDCSAPAATSFGIATGIAVMLLSFGPSVLLLYKKRLDAYPTRGPATE